MKPCIVVSGVNLVEGGGLSVLTDALQELSDQWSDRYEIVALVHDRRLFCIERIRWIEFPAVKSSWLRRLFFEYHQCLALSRTLQPHLWFAMHDTTPRVAATRRAVYCHNPAPFASVDVAQSFRDWRFSLFQLCYGWLYRLNIRRNDAVVVQQQWLRERFASRYQPRCIVVAHPSIARLLSACAAADAAQVRRFFYPAYPRSFKNVEVLLAAAQLLERRSIERFEIWLTCDGTENAYAARLRREFEHLATVRWLGLLPREHVFRLYGEADCLVFPSKLETWGMPISEFRQTGKPMLLADLPYAHETAGDYAQVRFFDCEDCTALADILAAYVAGTLSFESASAVAIPEPYAQDWHELFAILMDSDECRTR